MHGGRPLRLASASPRRRELLEAAGFAVTVVTSGADESWPGGDPAAAAVVIARRKLAAVSGSGPPDQVTVAADTVVWLEGHSLGKPADAADAVAMLSALAGREHLVVTGWCVERGAQRLEGAALTRVTFRELEAAEIRRYVDSGEPFDKAGAYAIQGRGGALVDRVEGSYTNIVGLPLAEVLGAVRAVSGS